MLSSTVCGSPLYTRAPASHLATVAVKNEAYRTIGISSHEADSQGHHMLCLIGKQFLKNCHSPTSAKMVGSILSECTHTLYVGMAQEKKVSPTHYIQN